MTDDTLFTDPSNIKPVYEIDPKKDYLPELVGEGKKYSDPSALARSRLEADNHIARLERENAGVRAELQKRLTVEELMTKLQASQAPVIGTDNQTPKDDGVQTQQTANGPQKPEDIQKLVQAELARARAVDQATNNLQFAKTKLIEAFGDNFKSVLDAKVKELGVTQEYMNQLAATAPNVLLKLVEAEKPVQTQNQNQQTRSISSEKQILNTSTPNDGFRGQKFYTELLKKEPTVFWNAKTQLEMHNMAMKDPQRYAAS